MKLFENCSFLTFRSPQNTKFFFLLNIILIDLSTKAIINVSRNYTTYLIWRIIDKIDIYLYFYVEYKITLIR